jgi:hypothetical protein
MTLAGFFPVQAPRDNISENELEVSKRTSWCPKKFTACGWDEWCYKTEMHRIGPYMIYMVYFGHATTNACTITDEHSVKVEYHLGSIDGWLHSLIRVAPIGFPEDINKGRPN